MGVDAMLTESAMLRFGNLRSTRHRRQCSMKKARLRPGPVFASRAHHLLVNESIYLVMPGMNTTALASAPTARRRSDQTREALCAALAPFRMTPRFRGAPALTRVVPMNWMLNGRFTSRFTEGGLSASVSSVDEPRVVRS